MFQEDLCLGSLAAAAPVADWPPDWAKTMLENQSRNHVHLRIMIPLIFNHTASSTQAPQRTTSTASRWDHQESSQPTVRERWLPYSDSPFALENPERALNITGGLFAAEIEVIQWRAHNLGSTRVTPSRLVLGIEIVNIAPSNCLLLMVLNNNLLFLIIKINLFLKRVPEQSLLLLMVVGTGNHF